MKLINVELPSKQKAAAKEASPSIFDHPLFELPFRSFFLLAPLFAALSLLLWLLVLNGSYSVNAQGLNATLWHMHEMVFGFAATVAVAFILTAVQTWTGQRSVHGKALVFVLVMWLFIRLALLINNALSVDLAIAVQVLWWLTIVVLYSRIVIKAGNKRNYLFIPMLTLMGVLNVSVLLADRFDNTVLAMHLSRSMILVMGLLMGIIGGRVIPFFSQKGLASKVPIASPKLLNISVIIVSFILVVVFSLSHFFETVLRPAVLMITAGSLHLLCLCYWRSWQTLSVPLLWSLHLSYALLSIGLILLGLSDFYAAIAFSNALHLIAIGGVSLMILSMSSRVSLGHTGRALTIKPVIELAFVMMLMAAIIRGIFPMFYLMIAEVGLPFAVDPHFLAWNLGGGLWILAMLVFFKTYLPILMSPKAR